MKNVCLIPQKPEDTKAQPEGKDPNEKVEKNEGAGLVNDNEEDPLSLPPHGTEVFIGGLPRSCTEDELREFASKAGDVHSIRLSKDPASSAQNKGYGFVVYKEREAALRAMETLNGSELPEHTGTRVRAAPSQANNRLWIGNIPLTIDKDGLRKALEEELHAEIKGLQDIDLLKNKENPEQNRGYAFLDFYNAACAMYAKKKLRDVKLQDRVIQVEVADPSHGGAKNIYVGNLPPDSTEEALKSAFQKYGLIERTFIPRARDYGSSEDSSQARAHFGFVHFMERSSAVKAVEDEEKPEINGVKVTVKFGKSESGAQQRRGSAHGRDDYRQPYYDNRRFGMPGMVMPMVPVQLPNGQMGYMIQPAGLPDDDGGMYQSSYGGPRGGGSWGRGGGRRGGGYRGRGRGYGGQHSRYQPY